MKFNLRVGPRDHEVRLGREGDKFQVEVDGTLHVVEVARAREGVAVTVGGQVYDVAIAPGGVTVNGALHPVAMSDLEAGAAPGAHAHHGHARVKPPMPGKIVAVRVKVGDEVKAGQTLLVLEAMKMQNEIHSPANGVVKEVRVSPGQVVEAKDVLVVIE